LLLYLETTNVAYSPDVTALVAHGADRETGIHGVWLWLPDMDRPEQIEGTSGWSSVSLEWAPDISAAIAIVHRYAEPRNRYTDRPVVYTISVSDRGIRKFKSVGQPQGSAPVAYWASDSESFYIPVRSDAGHEIWRGDIGKKTLRRIFLEPFSPADGPGYSEIGVVVASPDGEHLAFGRSWSWGTRQAGMCLLDLATGDAVRITWETRGFYQHYPIAWSQDGKVLTFARTVAGGEETWEIDVRKALRDMQRRARRPTGGTTR